MKCSLLAALTLCALPGAAGATAFSFGTVDATDVISSIIIAPASGDTSYTAGTKQLVIDAYVSTINFANRPSISINPGDVTFSSQLTLSNELLLGPAFDVAVVTGELSNGLADDFSITDIAGAQLLMGGDFDAPMSFSASTVTGTVSANLAASIGTSVSGDSDFMNAFGAAGSIDLKVVLGAGTICSTIATCPMAPLTSPAPTLHDFNGPTNGTIIPIPEPATGTLLGLALLGLTRHARARRTVS
jgi:hypothetical protein